MCSSHFVTINNWCHLHFCMNCYLVASVESKDRTLLIAALASRAAIRVNGWHLSWSWCEWATDAQQLTLRRAHSHSQACCFDFVAFFVLSLYLFISYYSFMHLCTDWIAFTNFIVLVTMTKRIFYSILFNFLTCMIISHRWIANTSGGIGMHMRTHLKVKTLYCRFTGFQSQKKGKKIAVTHLSFNLKYFCMSEVTWKLIIPYNDI